MEKLVCARCPLFGLSMDEMKLEGQYIRKSLLQPELQSCLGETGYDAGAKLLTDFFRRELAAYLVPGLDTLGREIIETFMRGGTAEDYLRLTPLT